MSFFKKLFGGGGAKTPAGPAQTAEHKGFTIEARPFAEAGQYQTAGVVAKVIGGERKEHRFVRADRFSVLEDAANHAITKGIQMIDERGERMFD